MLTSSDPVSEGLAFLGAMTGESDPSKSNWKTTTEQKTKIMTLLLLTHQLKDSGVSCANYRNSTKSLTLFFSPGHMV